jgi:hypothetical protein
MEETQPETVHQGELSIINRKGDTTITWSSDRPVEVENARENFRKMREKGYLAYRMTRSGDKGEQIHEFDPLAEKIILAPPMAGG